MRLFRYFLIMVVGAAIGAGGWVAWQSITKESPSAGFLEKLRLPQYKPDGHSSSTRGDELLIGQGYQLPYVSLSWDIHPSSASETSHDNDWPHTHVRLNLVDTELDVDMGGQRTAIEVDGVQGWFTRLRPDDFLRLEDRDKAREQWLEWRFERSVYTYIKRSRGPEDSPGNKLRGEAIALQWNREGIHYVLIAQDKDPMNKEELLKTANSMAPSEWPFPSFGSRPG